MCENFFFLKKLYRTEIIEYLSKVLTYHLLLYRLDTSPSQTCSCSSGSDRTHRSAFACDSCRSPCGRMGTASHPSPWRWPWVSNHLCMRHIIILEMKEKIGIGNVINASQKICISVQQQKNLHWSTGPCTLHKNLCLKSCILLQHQYLALTTNMIHDYQTSLNRIRIVINYSNVAGCTWLATYRVITNCMSRPQNFHGFSVMLWDAKF